MVLVLGWMFGSPFGNASPFDVGVAARGCCDWAGSFCWRLLLKMKITMRGRVCSEASGCVAALEEGLGCGSGTFVERTRVERQTLPGWMPFYCARSAYYAG